MSSYIVHMACGWGDGNQLECVKHLVEKLGAEVNQQDRTKGWTPLHRCARMYVPRVRVMSSIYVCTHADVKPQS